MQAPSHHSHWWIASIRLVVAAGVSKWASSRAAGLVIRHKTHAALPPLGPPALPARIHCLQVLMYIHGAEMLVLSITTLSASQDLHSVHYRLPVELKQLQNAVDMPSKCSSRASCA
ncbi:hypothetical protein IWZ03DRAFT_8278 [Phyllosticta citriasiana]|uniref:Uncharacterized protein n=1 Tax=Phyllosticta citriasiana TaxID=595635 RepID=A0ABR1KXS9_9PEZI